MYLLLGLSIILGFFIKAFREADKQNQRDKERYSVSRKSSPVTRIDNSRKTFL